MFLNVAFYYGFQWTAYSVVSGELHQVDNPAGMIRITSNQIQPRIRNLHAKMTKSRPKIDPIPADWTEDAILSAEVSRKLLDQWQDLHGEDELDSETIDWFLLCGDCFRKVGFDPTEGEAISVDKEKFYEYTGYDGETGLAQMEEIFTEGQNNVNFNVGEIFDDVVPAFEVYVPEYGTNMRNVGELLHVKLMPFEDAKSKWGAKKLAKVSPTKEIHMGTYFQTRLLGMAGQDIGSSTGISEALLRGTDLVFIKELWQAPTRKHPKGFCTIVVGESTDGVVYAEDNPWYDAWAPHKILSDQGYIPFIKFACINAPGKFWQVSPVEGMRPLQAEYNRCITDITQNRVTVGRNKIVAPKTSQIDEEEIANIHGQFLQFSGIIPPQIIPAQPLPQQTEREIERNSHDLDTISGSHEVSRAQVPTGVKSGIAINYLLEQDDTTLGPIIGNYERAKVKLAKAKLGLAKYFYIEERILENTSVNDIVAVSTFKGSNITTRIKLVPGSALPQSRAALQAIYMDLYERGAIVDEVGAPNPQKLFKMLRETLPVDAFFEDQSLDVARVQRENLLLSQGAMVRAMPWEDHKIHFEEHNKYRKSERYYRLMEMNPQVAQMFDSHVNEHLMFLMPPIPTPGAEEQAMGGMGPIGALPSGGASGMLQKAARSSPSFVGQGTGGSLNNPTANYTSSAGGRSSGR